MRKFLLILLFSGLLAGGYWGYERFLGSASIEAWSLIPSNSLIVYESSKIFQSWEQLQQKKVWRTAANIPGIGVLTKHFTRLETGANQSGVLEKLLKNNLLLVAMSPVSKEKLGYLYVLQVKNIDQHAAISQILEGGYSRKTRKYQGYKISEIVNRKTGKSLSYIFYKNYLAASTTPFLVEDAIRTIKNKEFSSFKESNQDLFTLSKLNQDDGNIYINTKNFSNLFHLFYKGKKEDLVFLNQIASATFLDMQIGNGDVLLNGFSLSKDKNNYLNIFNGNIGTGFSLMHLISKDAATLIHTSYENPGMFLNKTKDYLTKYTSDLSLKRISHQKKYDINYTSFNNWMDTESCIFTMEGAYPENPERIVLIKIRDQGAALNQLSRIAERVFRAQKDTLFYEKYSDYKITLLPLSDFPATFLGPPFTGLETVYFTSLSNHIVFGSSLEAIKKLLDDIENEDTWGKSLVINKFLTLTNKESNLSFYVNMKTNWQGMVNKINSGWKQFMENYADVLRQFEMAGVQFSTVDDKYFTNITVFQPNELQKIQKGKNIKPELFISLAPRIISKPKVVRNHVDNSLETLVQDSVNYLYLISNQFEVLWSNPLKTEITTEIYQVDYYKNGKLQYLFGAGKELHLLDRNNNSLRGYPISFNNKINTLNVIDYDKSGRYRWAVSDAAGSQFLLDKEGRQLGGWDPLPYQMHLTSPLQHYRIRGKDILIAAEDKGKISAFNRRGRMYDGFPINLDLPIDPNFAVTVSYNFERSNFTIVSREGEIIVFNFEGKVLKRDQLIKGSARSHFSLIKNKNGGKYILMRQDNNRISILDREGVTKFEKDYISDHKVITQYYDFGPGKELIVIIDPVQEFAYLYNGKGQLLNNVPLETGKEVGILYYDNRDEYVIYKTYNKELSRVVISN